MSLKKSLVSSVLASSVALSACAPAPAEEPAPGDAPRPTAEPGSHLTGATLATAVSGSRVMHFRTDTGDFTQPVVPSSDPLTAFDVVSGARHALTVVEPGDGTFQVTDAPAGDYFLQVGGLYVASDARSLSLDRYDLGRRDRATASTSHLTVKLTASNLSPVADSLSLRAFSTNVGSGADLFGGLSSSTPVSSVTDLEMSYDDFMSSSARLVDGSKGDRLLVQQLVDRADGDFPYQALDRTLVPAPFTLSTDAAAPSALSGTFEPAPQQTVRFQWARSRFESWRTLTHPLATVSASASQLFALYLLPWSSDDFYGYAGEVASGYIPTGYADVAPSVTFGNPYLSWGLAGYVSHRFSVPLRLPGTTAGALNVTLTDMKPLDGFLAGLVTPRITPVQNLAVDGLGAWQDRTLTSLTPKLTWSAPRVGTPTAYAVRLYRLYVTTPTTTTRYTSVGSFLTGRTDLTVPPGVLQTGQRYAAVVTAYFTPGVDYAHQPFALESLADVGTASAVTSILTAPATGLLAAASAPADAPRPEGAASVLSAEEPEPSRSASRRPVTKTDAP